MAASGLSKTKTQQEIKAEEAKLQLEQWLKPHYFKLDKEEELLAIYESPALGGVVGLICHQIKQEFFLVKFEFKESEMTRVHLASLDRLNELGKLSVTVEFRDIEMVGNRLLIHMVTVARSDQSRVKQHIILFDFNGLVVHEVFPDNEIFNDLSRVHLMSPTSYLGKCAPIDHQNLFKLHRIESKAVPSQVGSEDSVFFCGHFRRLSYGRAHFERMISDRDLTLKGKISGIFLCETQKGYLVFDTQRCNINRYSLRIYDKENFKILMDKALADPFTGRPDYACQKANGNIVVIDTDHHAGLLDADLNLLAVHDATHNRITPIIPNDGLPYAHERKELYGDPVRFFSDRRDFVAIERKKLLERYFNFLVHLIPFGVLQVIIDYYMLDFCDLIDEAVKATLLSDIPPAQVIPNGELGKLQFRR